MKFTSLMHLGLVLLATGCRQATAPSPQPLEIVPPRALEGKSTEIIVKGNYLTGHVFTDFSSPGLSTVESDYTVLLGNTSLRQVRQHPEGYLTAIVPEGISPGQYDVTVIDPLHNQGVLKAGYQVLSVGELNQLVSTYQFDAIGPQHVFVPFTVSITALDSQNALVPYNGAVSFTDVAGTVVPRKLGYFSNGRWTGLVEVRQSTESEVLTVKDALGNLGVSQVFTVGADQPASILIASPAQIVQAGNCSQGVSLQLLDGAGSETTATSPLVIGLSAQPPAGFLFYQDAQCSIPITQISIAEGANNNTVFFKGDRQGTVQLSVASTGFSNTSQLETIVPAPPTQLAFTNPALTAAAGSCSGALQIAQQDAFGNAIPVSAPLTVTLAANPTVNLTFFTSLGCVGSPVSSLVIPAGSPSMTFYFQSTHAGNVQLSGSGGTLTAASQTENVTPLGAVALGVTTAAQKVVINTCSSVVDVQTQDTYGNASPLIAGAAIAFTASLASPVSPTPTFNFFSDPSCTSLLANLSIAANQTQAHFYFKGSVSGSYSAVATYDVGLSSTGIASTSQQEKIIPIPPSALVFVTSSQTLSAGQCSGIVTLQSNDLNGVAASPSTDTPVGLSGPTGMSFYTAGGCSGPGVSSVNLLAGASTLSFYFKSVTTNYASPGETLSAAVPTWTPASQTETINPGPPSRLGFTSQPYTGSAAVAASTCSPEVDIGVVDALGNVSPRAANTLVNVAVSPSGIAFFSDAGCALGITQVTILGGSGSNGAAKFYFKGNSAAQYTVNLTASGLTLTTQNEAVKAGLATQFAFTTSPAPTTAGSCSPALSVQSRDSFGNPSAVTTPVTIALSSAPSAGFGFYSDGSCNGLVTSIQFDSSSDTRNFYVLEKAAGSYQVTAAAFGTSQVQTETINPASPAQFVWNNISSPQSLSTSFSVTLQAQDVFNNLTPSFIGQASLSVSPGGLVTCVANCADTSTTKAFIGGTWTGSVSLDSAGLSRRLVASSTGFNGTSNPFDVTPVRSAPSVRFTAVPGAVATGGTLSFDASLSSDYQTPSSGLQYSWDYTGTATFNPPWTPWSSTKTSTSPAYSTAGVYTVRVAVMDSDGDVGYGATNVVVTDATSKLCVVNTNTAADDLSANCTGTVTLTKAVRIANASALPTVIAFSSPMSIAAPASFTLTTPTTLVGGDTVTLSQNLISSSALSLFGLQFSGTTGLTVFGAGTQATLFDDTYQNSRGLQINGSSSIVHLRMVGCTTDCLTYNTSDPAPQLTVRGSEFRNAAGFNGINLKACSGASQPILQSNLFSQLATGLVVQAACIPSVIMQNETFDANGSGISLSGGSAHVLENSIFTNQTVDAATCTGATFTRNGYNQISGNAASSCVGADSHSLASDPNYNSVTRFDYRLQPLSTAVDSATDIAGADFNGEAPGRFFGAGPDRGAFESH